MAACSRGSDRTASTPAPAPAPIPTVAPPADAAAPPADVPPEPDAAAAEDWPGMEHETIGGITLHMAAADAIKKLGAPTGKSPAQYEGATGDYDSTWTFKGGLSLVMGSDTKQGPWTVRAISVSGASTAKTVEGIGVGSTLAEVKTAYAGYLSPPDGEPDQWLVGSVYGGMLLTVKQDRVTAIYLGALAF